MLRKENERLEEKLAVTNIGFPFISTPRGKSYVVFISQLFPPMFFYDHPLPSAVCDLSPGGANIKRSQTPKAQHGKTTSAQRFF